MYFNEKLDMNNSVMLSGSAHLVGYNLLYVQCMILRIFKMVKIISITGSELIREWTRVFRGQQNLIIFVYMPIRGMWRLTVNKICHIKRKHDKS